MWNINDKVVFPYLVKVNNKYVEFKLIGNIKLISLAYNKIESIKCDANEASIQFINNISDEKHEKIWTVINPKKCINLEIDNG